MIFLVLFIVKPWLIFAREHGNYSNIKAYKLVVVKLLPRLKHVFSHQKPKKFYRITNVSLNVHGLLFPGKSIQYDNLQSAANLR